MLDIYNELLLLELIPQQAGTATITGTGVSVDTLNTGDLDAAKLMITGISGSGSITVKLQHSNVSGSGYVDVPTTGDMPATAFTPVTANMTTPVLLAVDPRGLLPFVRAVATVTGITNFTIEVELLGRKLQAGFPTTSG